MEEEKMTLKDALNHLGTTDRRVPLIYMWWGWIIDEMELMVEGASEKDLNAFMAVVLALNKGHLDPCLFNQENKLRTPNYSEGIPSGSVIVPLKSSKEIRTNLLSQIERDALNSIKNKKK